MKDESPSGANREASKDVSGNVPSLGMVSNPAVAVASVESTTHEARYCRVLSAARNLRAFAELVETSLREMTFKDFCLARIMAPRECDAQLQTIGREVCASYRYEDYFRYDAIIGHAMNKTTPLFKSQVERCLAALPFAAPWVTRNFKTQARVSASYDGNLSAETASRDDFLSGCRWPVF